MRISDWSSDVCSSDLRISRCILKSLVTDLLALNLEGYRVNVAVIFTWRGAPISVQRHERLAPPQGGYVRRATPPTMPPAPSPLPSDSQLRFSRQCQRRRMKMAIGSATGRERVGHNGEKSG